MPRGLTPMTRHQDPNNAGGNAKLFNVHGWQEVEFSTYAETPQQAIAKCAQGAYTKIIQHKNLDDVTVYDANDQVVHRTNNVVSLIIKAMEDSLTEEHSDSVEELLAYTRSIIK